MLYMSRGRRPGHRKTYTYENLYLEAAYATAAPDIDKPGYPHIAVPDYGGYLGILAELHSKNIVYTTESGYLRITTSGYQAYKDCYETKSSGFIHSRIREFLEMLQECLKPKTSVILLE